MSRRPSPRALLALAFAGLAIGLAAMLLGPARDGRAPGIDIASIVTNDTIGARLPAVTPDPASADPVARGAYLALAGNCAGCHTARGGAPYAGGRPIATPFGTIHASNLTPDPGTGLGRWSADDFARALHEGRSRDGRALYPAFPYTDYTRVTRADADALFAFLRALPPVSAPNRPHALHFPWNLPFLLDAWRLLFFRPQPFAPDASRDDAWNRGAYLVQALGHCGACHTARNALGAAGGPALGGGALAAQGWHAPSLLDPREGGVQDWTQSETTDWLAGGVTARAVATGPMAQVVAASLQHLVPGDLDAMATYLRALPARPFDPPARRGALPPGPQTLALGERLYRDRCADCHGERGEGAPPAWPALAGNRTLTQVSPVNAIRSVLHGGFPPSTRANPRPHGMPPAAPTLDDREVAALVGWLRNAWGHAAPSVDAREVNALRPVPVD
jgi:mono/diheme cytochrome c family protein